jgi:hypothetical protein
MLGKPVMAVKALKINVGHDTRCMDQSFKPRKFYHSDDGGGK